MNVSMMDSYDVAWKLDIITEWAMHRDFRLGFWELVILHPCITHYFECSDLRTTIKEVSEMHLYHANEIASAAFKVDPSSGALAVVRPGGCIGKSANLEAVPRVDRDLGRCVVTR